MLVKENPRQGLRERQRAERSDKILNCTFELLAEHGYEALTMEMLAERVGISRQTLYHHFSSKTEITLRALLKLMEEGICTIESFDKDLSPIDRLEKVLRWMLNLRFQPAPAAFVKVKPILAPIKAHPDYLKAFNRRAMAISRIVEEAQELGQVKRTLPAYVIVQVLLNVTGDGRYEDAIEAGDITACDLIDGVVDVFLTGIREK
jgi:AcrR family transcriptional regulator